MIIVLSDNQRTCIDMLRDIILQFPAQTRDELSLFFPTFQESLIDKSLEILLKMKHIRKIEYKEQEVYINNLVNQEVLSFIRSREEDFYILKLLREIINSTDEEQTLINDIPYFARGGYPCALYFQCNNKLFEVYDFINKDITLLNNFINTCDNNSDPKYFPNNNRIAILGSFDLIDSVRFRNFTYAACWNNEGNLLIRKVEQTDD